MRIRKIKTSNQFEKEWDKLKQEVLSRPEFHDNSAKAKKDRIERARKDPWYFGYTYFPEYVRNDFASFHKEWPKIAQIKNEPVLVEAMRGGGKTTYFTFIEDVHGFVFGLTRNTLIGSYIEDKAKVFTGRMLLELLYNRKLKNDFGEIIGKNDRKAIGYFTGVSPITKKSFTCQAISIGQDPRGLIAGAYRPDKVRLDDIQSRKRAKSKKFVKEAVEWILMDMVPAMEHDYSFIICATPLNNCCVASTLEKGTETITPTKTFKFPAINKRGRATWPDKFPMSRLKKLKKTMGTLYFNQEFLLIAIALDERKFQEEWITYYKPEEILNASFDAVITFTDPSLTSKGDFKGTVCLGALNGIVYVLQARVRKETIKRMIQGMYDIYLRWNPQVMFVEDYTDKRDNISILDENFDTAAEKRSLYLPRKAIISRINKGVRIEGALTSPIENGIIRFLPKDRDQAVIIDHLLQYPDGTNDDGADILAGGYKEILTLIKRVASIPESKKVSYQSSTLDGYYEYEY